MDHQLSSVLGANHTAILEHSGAYLPFWGSLVLLTGTAYIPQGVCPEALIVLLVWGAGTSH